MVFVAVISDHIGATELFKVLVSVPELEVIARSLIACDLEKNGQVSCMLLWTEFVCYFFQQLQLVFGKISFSLELGKHGDCSVLLDRCLHRCCPLATLRRLSEVIELVALEVRYQRTLVLPEHELGYEKSQALKMQQFDDVYFVS